MNERKRGGSRGAVVEGQGQAGRQHSVALRRLAGRLRRGVHTACSK